MTCAPPVSAGLFVTKRILFPGIGQPPEKEGMKTSKTRKDVEAPLLFCNVFAEIPCRSETFFKIFIFFF